MRNSYVCEGSNRAQPPPLIPKASSFSSAPPLLGLHHPPSSSSSSSTEARTAEALRVHSLAEKRRRERINTHLSTLRQMIPNANKMDKASLLTQVIQHLRELKQKAMDVSMNSAVPSEVNHVRVESSSSSSVGEEGIQIKATLCCDDRPELFSDLLRAFRSLRLTVLRAELTSVGGRTQNVFTLCKKDGNRSMGVSSLMESLKQLLARVACEEGNRPSDLAAKGQRCRQF
ncbi:hypothetical protein HPP92_015417 [Vanilla planifolia]|uniref:BHLH domain-containing protein n=1 Tax=Vanilla planifolia TaxID=51239 RepID=A0A835UV33_VANPL|nr:hypothetical protein HPP92_015417 [Vanilla planifolia]